MNREKFIQKREFLYHLTDSRNIDSIIANRVIYSSIHLIDNAIGISNEQKVNLKRRRRNSHTIINLNGKEISIRDQKPLLPGALAKCLTQGWSPEMFIELLNRRVFFWPTPKRLWAHYNTYANENPTIIRVRTQDMLDMNNHAELCRLNSGATRPNSHLGGIAPIRGAGTFLPFEDFDRPISQVAEVTFPTSCQLPDQIWISGNPNGPWNIL